MIVLFYIYFLIYIGLGVFQPIDAVVRLLKTKRKDSQYATGLKRYLMAVIGYFVVLFMMFSNEQSVNYSVLLPNYLMILPWAYAIWYIIHIRVWKKKRKNIEAFDRVKLMEAPHEDRLILDAYPKKKIQLNHTITNPLTKNENSHKTIIKSLPILNKAK